jgi:hypothetical protein
MSNNQNTKTSAFESRFNELPEKVIGSMLVMARLSPDKDGVEEDFFNHVKESYTHDELAYLTAVHIGEKLKTLLQSNPNVTALVTLLRQADSLAKRMNEDIN